MDNPVEVADDGGFNVQCDLCDTEVIHSMAQILLNGLATASVDSTTGDIFKSPLSVAVAMKTELVGNLTKRSEILVRKCVDRDGDYSDQFIKASSRPTEFLSENLIDDFVASKRNMLSHVSGFLSSESRLNKIKDFTQKMEMENIWALDERKVAAETILKNIDMKYLLHCPERFDTPDKLAVHRSKCEFRIVNCINDGCLDSFSAIHFEKHDILCPFKLMSCEQLCEQHVMRCEMDTHCETVCPMKLINCPFYGIGCETAFAQCSLDRHCSGFFQTHLLYFLQVITRQDASVNDINQRLQLLEKVQSLNELSGALDIRSLTLVTKDQETKIKNLEVDLKEQETKIKNLEVDLKAQETNMKKLENQFRTGKA